MTNPTKQMELLKILHRRLGQKQWVSTSTSKVQVRTALGIVFSGFPEIDHMTGGFWQGDLIVIAASPCMGKTALALNIAEQVALTQGLPVAIFSMDMGVEQIVTRMAGSIGLISLDHLRTGKLTEHEGPRLADAIVDLSAARLHVSESGRLTFDELRKEASDFFRICGGAGLIVVDHLQLVRDKAAGGKVQIEASSETLQRLKMLAIELRCPIIALSQLPAGVETRKNKRPVIGDLGSTRHVERNADIVMLLYRDQVYTGDACNEPGLVDVIFVKRRDGSTGLEKLVFLEPIGRFESIADCI